MDLDQLARALAAFATYEPTQMPLHHCQLFLEVARRGHCTYRELEEELNLTNSSVSRTCTALATTRRTGRPGLNLLELNQDPAEGRRLLVSLSKDGKALLRQLRGL
jgi:DNA-binding MarR family transcriptional regulator